MSEDDTKITPGVRYYIKQNTIIGLVSPINSDRLPFINLFKFNEITEVEKFILAQYGKIVVRRSLSLLSKPVIISLYGTDSKTDATTTEARWNFHYRGITYLYFESVP